ncbi:MAG: hypothetical protein BEN18_04600 [Epulopiscium sp. Nuni2H_MBin001]|nr:MAG: hypothetical protein BEN18_04600 [Epulopiscium sp. Nuni2H_MBin001]
MDMFVYSLSSRENMSKRMKKHIALCLSMSLTISIIQMPIQTYASSTEFYDISTHWAQDSIEALTDVGILGGYGDGSFRPNNGITRAELSACIYKIFNLTPGTAYKSYNDVQSSFWYHEAISVVAGLGLINDYGNGMFYPDTLASREEVAYAIVQAYRLLEDNTNTKINFSFADSSDISDWAAESVTALVAEGLLAGRPDGTLDPKGAITRAEMATLLDRLTGRFITSPGNYTNFTETNNIIINTEDVTLTNVNAKGNVYIAQGVGDGDIYLNNVTIDGTLFIEGGGSNSIYINGGNINRIIIDKYDNDVRVVSTNKAEVDEIIAQSGCTIEGSMELDTAYVYASNVIFNLLPSKIFLADGISTTVNGTKLTSSQIASNGSYSLSTSSSSSSSSSSSGATSSTLPGYNSNPDAWFPWYGDNDTTVTSPTLATNITAQVGDDVTVRVSNSTTSWTDSVVLRLNGNVLVYGVDYTFDSSGNICLYDHLFTDAGSYTITAVANGFTTSTATVTITALTIEPEEPEVETEDPDEETQDPDVEEEKDTTAPTLSYYGANPLVIEYSSTMTYPSVTVRDNVDGTSYITVPTTIYDETGRIVSSVNTNNEGAIYTLIYQATDKAGNTSSELSITVQIGQATQEPVEISRPAAYADGTRRLYNNSEITTAQAISLDVTPADSSIYYSINGNGETRYTSPFYLHDFAEEETISLYAYATNDGVNSAALDIDLKIVHELTEDLDGDGTDDGSTEEPDTEDPQEPSIGLAPSIGISSANDITYSFNQDNWTIELYIPSAWESWAQSITSIVPEFGRSRISGSYYENGIYYIDVSNLTQAGSYTMFIYADGFSRTHFDYTIEDTYNNEIALELQAAMQAASDFILSLNIYPDITTVSDVEYSEQFVFQYQVDVLENIMSEADIILTQLLQGNYTDFDYIDALIDDIQTTIGQISTNFYTGTNVVTPDSFMLSTSGRTATVKCELANYITAARIVYEQEDGSKVYYDIPTNDTNWQTINYTTLDLTEGKYTIWIEVSVDGVVSNLASTSKSFWIYEDGSVSVANPTITLDGVLSDGSYITSVDATITIPEQIEFIEYTYNDSEWVRVYSSGNGGFDNTDIANISWSHKLTFTQSGTLEVKAYQNGEVTGTATQEIAISELPGLGLVPDANLRAQLGTSYAQTGVVDANGEYVLLSVLESLKVADYENAIELLSGLQYATNMYYLDVSNDSDISPNNITDLNFNHLPASLMYLDASNNPISSITGLIDAAVYGRSNGASNLKTLKLNNTNLTNEDISTLATLSYLGNLETLDISNIESLTDVSELKSLTSLKTLLLNDTQISSINGISALSKLTTLNIANTLVSDISPIATLTNLSKLYLPAGVTNISTITQLPSLTELIVHYDIVETEAFKTTLQAILGTTNEFSLAIDTEGLYDDDWALLWQEEFLEQYLPNANVSLYVNEGNEIEDPADTLVSKPNISQMIVEANGCSATITFTADNTSESAATSATLFYDVDGVRHTVIVDENNTYGTNSATWPNVKVYLDDLPDGNYTAYMYTSNKLGDSEIDTESFKIDNEAPMFIYTGSTTLNYAVGEGFSMPEVSAVDAVDGPLVVSSQITKYGEVIGAIDADEMGTYIVTYSATDSQGFTSTLVITIIVGDASKIELWEAIGIAQENAASVVVSSFGGEDIYPGTTWVTQSDLTLYEAAITTAQGVYDNENATDDSIANAIAMLAYATDMFNEKKQDGTFGTGGVVSGVTLPSEYTITLGDNTLLSATVSVENLANIVYVSSNENIVAIDGFNIIGTGIGYATVTVIATDIYGFEYTASCVVGVEPDGEINGLDLDIKTDTIFAGQSLQLTPIYLYKNSNIPDVSWALRDTDYGMATITQDGLVTAGSVTTTSAIQVTAAATVGSYSYIANSDITILPLGATVPNVSITFSDAALTLSTDDEPYELVTTLAPTAAQMLDITWHSTATDVVSVVDGVLTPVGAGTATITATVNGNGNATATCIVMVSGNGDSGSTESVPVDLVSLQSSLTLDVGDEYTLTAGVYPANATNQAINWTSSDSSLVSVSSAGVLTAHGAGDGVVITATSASNPDVSSTCTVTVNTVEPADITLNRTADTINIGGTVQLSAVISPSNATNQAVVWSSSDSLVAAVDENGLVTGLSEGTAIITVVTDNGVSADCEIEVVTSGSDIVVSKVEINPGVNQTIMQNQTLQLEALITPSAASNQQVTWSSSNESVATVDANGLVKGVGNGTAVITVTTDDGAKTDTITVVVSAIAATSITLNKSADVLLVNDDSKSYTQLVATVMPSDATNQELVWSSSDPSVATVDPTGFVSAVKTGVTTITAAISDDASLWATCSVTVSEDGDIATTGLTLNSTAEVVSVNHSVDLVATVHPTGASNQNIQWSTNNSSVATVDQYGTVTAVGEGSATITATQGSFSATCGIFCVNVPAASLSLNRTQDTIGLGSNTTLTATLGPENVSDGAITWSTSDASVVRILSQDDECAIIYGASTGEATITATASNGLSAECRVNVETGTISVTGITLDSYHYDLVEGEAVDLTAYLNPSGASNKTINWTLGNGNLAILDANADSATITAVGAGTTTVTATSADGGYTASCTLVITQKPAVEIDYSEAVLLMNETVQLTETITTGAGTLQSFGWSSSNPAVASVDENGVVSAVGYGNAIIYATAVIDGETVIAACDVTVTIAAPVATPSGGNTTSKLSVTLSAAEGATIYYTLNGVDLVDADEADIYVYTGPIELSTQTTLKAAATIEGATSLQLVEGYTFTPASPTNLKFENFSMDEGAVSGLATFSVTVSEITDGITLYHKTADESVFTASDKAAVSLGDTSATVSAMLEDNQTHSIYLVAHNGNETSAESYLYTLTLPNLEGLAADLESAYNLHSSMTNKISFFEGRDYDEDEQWVSKEAYDAYFNAIDEAQGVWNNNSDDTVAINNAIIALAEATAVFEAAISYGTPVADAPTIVDLSVGNGVTVTVTAAANNSTSEVKDTKGIKVYYSRSNGSSEWVQVYDDVVTCSDASVNVEDISADFNKATGYGKITLPVTEIDEYTIYAFSVNENGESLTADSDVVEVAALFNWVKNDGTVVQYAGNNVIWLGPEDAGVKYALPVVLLEGTTIQAGPTIETPSDGNSDVDINSFSLDYSLADPQEGTYKVTYATSADSDVHATLIFYISFE